MTKRSKEKARLKGELKGTKAKYRGLEGQFFKLLVHKNLLLLTLVTRITNSPIRSDRSHPLLLGSALPASKYTRAQQTSPFAPPSPNPNGNQKSTISGACSGAKSCQNFP